MRNRFFIPDLLFVCCSVRGPAGTPSARFNVKQCGLGKLLQLFLWALLWRSFSYLVGKTQQWTWLLQWIVLCDPAPQRCCVRRGPISRLPIVVVADHKRNDEPLRRMTDHARQFRLNLLFSSFCHLWTPMGEKVDLPVVCTVRGDITFARGVRQASALTTGAAGQVTLTYLKRDERVLHVFCELSLRSQALRAMEYCTFSYNLTVAYNICVQPTVDYIGVPRTVGVVWVCRRFDHRPFCVFSPVLSIAACLTCYFCIRIVYFQPSECVAQAIARGSQLQIAVPAGDAISGHCSLQLPGALACATRSARLNGNNLCLQRWLIVLLLFILQP